MVARCIVLLKRTNSIREHYSHKRVHVIGYDVEVSCAVQSCVHRYQGTQCTPGKHSLHHNSTATSLKRCHLAGGVHEFVLFATYSDLAIYMTAHFRIRFLTATGV
ncbi:hypothetical protein AVEN_218510-1 [Araneus ventricosus]|uniref:Uncharacterized protein n=1 Tax=Araneus ventricosus TaxID=182803 RepID=A0A4Y2I725_ARAVE|nr:hypothetical protein AVEN_218510-1 [Araneus ventricosus]